MKEHPLPIQVDETTPGNPDFMWGVKMAGIFFWFIFLAYGVFFLFSRWAMLYFDIEREREFFWGFLTESGSGELLDPSILSYQLPESIRNDVYIIESSEANAYAAIGARVMVTTALLEEVANQEELIFIIGHEMAHRDNQDALRNFLVHAPFSMTMMILGYESAVPYDKISNLVVKHVGRAVESEADQWGIELLHSLGLNSKCATGFFERNGSELEKYVKFLSTHPVSQDRIDTIISSAGKYSEKQCTQIN